jgi:LysR family nitrogen assimilation transcriptional regulator
MDTAYLKSFLKIAETGSISRASESLGITQPSLSQQLQRLEDEIGVPLFQRTARGVTLTEAGRIFQERARQLLQWSDHAIEEVRQLSAEPSGAVVLAVPYSISKLAGFTLVETFIRRAPQVRLRLVEAFTGQIRGWLEEAKVDLGIMHELGAMRNLASRRLATEELYLVGPPGRYGGLDSPPSVAPSELAGLPMILPGPQHGLRQLIEQEAKRLGTSISVHIEIDAMMHVPLLIATGEGYSILPLPAIRDELKAARISIARIGDGAMRRTICLVRNSNQVVTKASARCEDLTIKVLMSLIERGAWNAEPAAT